MCLAQQSCRKKKKKKKKKKEKKRFEEVFGINDFCLFRESSDLFSLFHSKLFCFNLKWKIAISGPRRIVNS